MNVSLGDVVLIDFPFSSGIGSKFRPALVVQSDELNRKLTDTIVAGISSKTGLAGKEPTQVLVDPQAADGLSSGLIQTSVIKCHRIYTIEKAAVRRVLGTLSVVTMERVDEALKLTLAVE